MSWPPVDKRITFIRSGTNLYRGNAPEPWKFLAVGDVIAAGEGIIIRAGYASTIGLLPDQIEPLTPLYTLVDA